METKLERYERLLLEEKEHKAELLAEHAADLALTHRRRRTRPAQRLQPRRKSRPPVPVGFSAKRSSLGPNDSLLLHTGRVLVHDRNYGSIELSMQSFAPKRRPRPLGKREKELYLMLAEERASRRQRG